jgi:branched-chain amino acid transport system ATP-binding protein
MSGSEPSTWDREPMIENGGKQALRLEKVSAGYGQTVVIEDLDFTLGQGESVSIIGRNGVGKTTLLATIMGHTNLHHGRVAFRDIDITSMEIFQRARSGLGYVPQEREIFPSLTVSQNLLVAAQPGRWTFEEVFGLFPQLRARANNLGNQLSGGEQQMLSIARALVGNPSVMLMDEPSEGLAPVIVEDLVQAMQKLRSDGGLSILLVEQNTRIALDFSKRVVVMDRGRIVYDGSSADLKADPALIDRMIGVGGT